MQDGSQSAHLSDIVAQIRAQIPDGATVAFVSGYFNVVHPGHVRLLKLAAECSDVLVVGVLNYDLSKNTLPGDVRLESVRSISMVSHSFLLDVPPDVLIRQLRPDVVLKGKEFEKRHNPEAAAVEAYGGKLLFSSGEMSFSSLDILEREYSETNFSTISKPTDFPKRHKFSIAGLKDLLPRFTKMKVLVIGDLIIDEYIDCDPLGMSQEDPTIVVRPISRKRFVGGSGIVAGHAAGMGAQVQHFSIAGEDETAQYGRKMLAKLGVNATIITDDSRPTTLKQRYRAAGKTLLRVSELRQHAISAEISDKVLAAVKQHIHTADLLVFSDFNYGCLPQPLVDEIIALGQDAGVAMVADSQASSQIADISRFRQMHLITPTEREARLALQEWDSGLMEVIETLQSTAQADNVVITLGAEGILIYAQADETYMMDRLPALNSAPKDVAGAGDSFLISSSMALRAGATMWQAAYLGAIAAACQVSRVGNTPLTVDELIREIDGP